MKKFTFTPKIALIIVLGIISIAGIYLYLRTANRNTTPDAGDRNFLSFFGQRNLRPTDETTVPGVTPGTDTAGSGTSTAGVDTGGDTAGSTTGQATAGFGQGDLLLRPIGIGMQTGGGSGVSSGLTSGFNGGGTGTGTGGTGGGGTGTDTGGGTGGTTPQIDCTPPQLPYTSSQVAELRDLTQRFYRIAANLHTDADIESEVNTRKSYFDLYNQTIDYTKQCYAELKDPQYASKVKNSSARWHPYLTDAVLKKIVKYDPRVAFVTKTSKDRLNDEISKIGAKVVLINQQIKYLEGVSPRNANQDNLLSSLKDTRNNYNYQIDVKKDEISKLTTTQDGISQDIVGTFFTEDVYKLVNLKVARENDNSRRGKIWNYVAEYLTNVGEYEMHAYFYGGPGSNDHPLKESILDKFDPSLDDAPRNAEGFAQSYMHRFRMLEDGLNIW